MLAYLLLEYNTMWSFLSHFSIEMWKPYSSGRVGYTAFKADIRRGRVNRSRGRILSTRIDFFLANSLEIITIYLDIIVGEI